MIWYTLAIVKCSNFFATVFAWWSNVINNLFISYTTLNARYSKAKMRDLIAATGLIILLKLDSTRRFFISCDLEIWWTTSKNNRAPLLYYIKLCASIQIHQWIKVELLSASTQFGSNRFFVQCDIEIWHWKTIGHLFDGISSCVLLFVAIGEFKLEL